MKLYELNQEIQRAWEACVDTETGEVTGDLSVLDELMLARDVKIENTALLYKNILAELKAVLDEKAAFDKRAKSLKNRAESVRTYLENNLNGESFKTPKTAISWRKSESVEVPDIEKLDEDYLRFKAPEPDKTEIRKAIKAGVKVKGAYLVEKMNIQIK